MGIDTIGRGSDRMAAGTAHALRQKVRLEQVDGGPRYYGEFTKGLPVNPRFFPIAVWGAYNQTRANRNLDAAAGINTYQWVADNSFMDEIQADGRFWMIQVYQSLSAANRTSKVTGRYTEDELDMQCGDNQCAEEWGQQETIIRNQNCVTRCPDGLPLYANYGKGVMFWQTDAVASRWVNGTSSFGRYQDIVHDDVYWFTDPYVCWSQSEGPRFYGQGSALPANWCRNAANYGDTVTKLRRLDALDGKRVPIWNVVEASWPFENQANARAIEPAELRAAVWHSLIAGARGILWFQHSFGGPCAGDHHVIRSNCEGTRPAVTAVNRQVTDLAPVLNAPTVTRGHSITDTMEGRARHMIKWQGGHFYIFIGADRSGGQASFSMPCLGDATAINLGESTGNLVIPITNGQFTDQFADKNAVHIYRINSQSRCGLSRRTGPGSGADRTPGSGRARVRRLPSRVSVRSGRLKVVVRCTADCAVRSRLTTRLRSRRIVLASARRRFSAGRHRIVLRLSRLDRRRVAGGRQMRLRTVILQRGGSVRRTQRITARNG